MRRSAGIVIGAFAACALIGSGTAAAWRYADATSRTVGTWHDAPATGAVPPETAPPALKTAPGASSRRLVPESAPIPADRGRQQVGQVLRVDRLLGYGGAPAAQTFTYPGAAYVKVHFDRLAIAPGDHVTVSNADGTESYRYAGSPAAGPAGTWAMSITGDTAEVRLHRGTGPADDAGLGIDVDRVARGNTRTEQATVPADQLVEPGRSGREESVCGSDESKDAVCYRSADPVAYTRSKAIARLLINGTELCTGWRLGPKDRMITNNHCLATSADAAETEVWFNYQCVTCGGAEPGKPTKVWGAQVLATDHVLDYTLFTIDRFASVQRYGFLSFDTARPAKGQELYIPQHPSGMPTRIAGALGDKAGTCAVASNSYDGYAKGSDVSYYCDTEGGSSGSPVLSRKTDKVVALHHFGGCPNAGVRGDLLAAKLRRLL